MSKVTFMKQIISLEVPDGMTLLEAAKKAELFMETPCNGRGTCGKCKVKIRKGTKEETVLACQTRIDGDMEVLWNSIEKVDTGLQILNTGIDFQYAIQPYISKKFDGQNTILLMDGLEFGLEQGDTTKELYGVAIDIGTTTLVASLIDMNTGSEITSASALNPQATIAQDVVSRIEYASEPEGLEKMFHRITNEFNLLISELCMDSKVSPSNIYEVIYSGNTTMIHLAADINPKSLGKAPYTPAFYGGDYRRSVDLGLRISPYGKIYFPPIISSYVGPDITSGVLSTRLPYKKGKVFFIDIGTNGEMILSHDGQMSATSTAAGPAFEGMNITFGMRAGDGAIEHFHIDEENQISIDVIGNVPAIGICGSGLFDIVGELCRTGIIMKTGRFIKPAKLSDDNPLKNRLVDYEGKTAFELCDGVYLTMKDVRQIQLAKGAVASGVEALLESQHMEASEVDEVWIAGSFGYHLTADSLVNMSIMPKEFEDKIHFVGNTSKTGAIAFLLNKDFRQEMIDVVKKIHTVELSHLENYHELFMKALSF